MVRDVGRVLQMPYGQVDRICKLVPNNPGQAGHAAARRSTASRVLQQMRDERRDGARGCSPSR